MPALVIIRLIVSLTFLPTRSRWFGYAEVSVVLHRQIQQSGFRRPSRNTPSQPQSPSTASAHRLGRL